jgi:hypothetical protein
MNERFSEMGIEEVDGTTCERATLPFLGICLFLSSEDIQIFRRKRGTFFLMRKGKRYWAVLSILKLSIGVLANNFMRKRRDFLCLSDPERRLLPL